MELTRDASAVVDGAYVYAKSHQQEYITPETLLLSMCDRPEFASAFMECGGNLPALALDLKQYLKNYIGRSNGREPGFSAGSDLTFQLAAQSAAGSGRTTIGTGHLIHAIWHLKDSYAVYYVRKQGVEEAELLRRMAMIEEGEGAAQQRTGVIRVHAQQPGGEQWKLFAPCLNDTLKDENPLIGRDTELERMTQILCRKDKNNALLIGEPGVGKTAVVYGFVEKLRAQEVPEPVKNCRVFALDLGSMLAGTQYRGDFEKRFTKVLSEIGKEEAPVIFIDEIHNLSGAGAVGESSFDASNMLKPYLADGHIRFIGATTFEEYKKHFEKSKSLVRRFQNIEVKEPTEEEAVSILKGLKKHYEEFHGVTYQKGVLKYAVAMSKKHVHERFLPDKAIDLMDEAGAFRRLHPLEGEKQTVDKDVIAEVLTKICRVPIETVETEDRTGLLQLEEKMKAKIFGQDEAVAEVVNAVKFSRAGLQEEAKPLASLLFVGPTGVGKTEVAKTLAQELGAKLLRFDMSEYGEKHAVAKLIGAPAGYVGYEEGGILTEEIRKHPAAVLLLDEIEKAHPDIYNVLLQVMDYATLTDNQGRKADFRNVVIIMTSNAGANRLGKGGIGFQRQAEDTDALLDAVKHTFQPEFRNRLHKVVVFHSMDDAMAERIVDKKLGELEALLAKKKIRLKTEQAAKALVKEKGISVEFGAREIDRVIRSEIKPLFVDDILFGSLKDGGSVRLIEKNGYFAVKTDSGNGGK